MGQSNMREADFQTFTFEQYFPNENSFQQQTQQQPQQRKIHKAAKKNTTSTKSSNNEKSFSPLDNKIKQSQELKNQGNSFIQKKQYQSAIDCYTQAINLYDKDTVYFSNRAVAHKLLNNIKESKADAQRAAKLDDQNARAHFVIGTIILIEVQLYPILSEQLISQASLGINTLEKAHSILKDNNDEQKKKLKILIKQNMGKGRRMVFLLALEMDKRNVTYLKDLLKDIALRQNKKIDFAYVEQQMSKKALSEIPIPTYFTCIMTYEIMNEPILFNTGQTYEKESIIQQFKSNGLSDPITRDELDPKNARPNLQLLQGIFELRNKYGWIGIEQEDNYKIISFE